MAKYEVFVRETNDEGGDYDVDQNLRDIAESIKEHIEEQFGRSSVTIEEMSNGANIVFEVIPRKQTNYNAMKGEGIV